MIKEINFDMDGTIANLYGVDNWLQYLINGYTKPYREAKPLVNMRELGRELNRLKEKGYVINIISWLAKGGNIEYNKKVTETKINWLKRHIGAVEWDKINIVEYGTPKYTLGDGILFDDEERNRTEWETVKGNKAFNVNGIIEILKEIN